MAIAVHAASEFPVNASTQRRVALVGAGLGFVAFLLAMVGSRSNTLANGDELYHLIAASSWLESGEFRVGEGEYDRASLYTRLVGVAYALFGESLASAKLVGALCFGLLVAAMHVVLYRVAGLTIALTATGLLAFSPHALEIASTIRFYMPQALLFWIGAWSAYGATYYKEHRPILVVLSVATLGLALHFQIATAIGIAALVGWVGIQAALALAARCTRDQLIVLGVVAALVSMVAVAILPLEMLWDRYQSAALWNAGSDVRYYYWVMTEDYNPFWGILPICALLALYSNTRIAVFSAWIFGMCFVAHSFGGMKEDRYLFYAFPFFFLVIALGLRSIFSIVADVTGRLLEQFKFLGARGRSFIAGSVAAGSIAFLVISNLGYVAAGKDLFSGNIKREQPDWASMSQEYGDALQNSSVLLTNTPLHVLYYLDRMPIGIGRNRLVTGGGGVEFAKDFRTGARLISSVASIEKVLDCVPDGYLLVEERQWLQNSATGIGAEMIPLIERRMQRVDVPEGWDIRAYSWKHEDVGPRDRKECSAALGSGASG
ncbi:MAG: ArnT family glycosyltransferase [Pseudomonadota bacterium]